MRELSKIENLADPNAEFVIVAPDSGAVDRNKFYSSGLKKPLAMIYKSGIIPWLRECKAVKYCQYQLIARDVNAANRSSLLMICSAQAEPY